MTIEEVLWEFAGATALAQAENAVEHIEWLRRQLQIAETQERAAMAVAAQERKKQNDMRTTLVKAMWCMHANDPLNAERIFGVQTTEGDGNEQNARQTAGAQGQK